jgi:hypothetical protein
MIAIVAYIALLGIWFLCLSSANRESSWPFISCNISASDPCVLFVIGWEFIGSELFCFASMEFLFGCCHVLFVLSYFMLYLAPVIILLIIDLFNIFLLGGLVFFGLFYITGSFCDHLAFLCLRLLPGGFATTSFIFICMIYWQFNFPSMFCKIQLCDAWQRKCFLSSGPLPRLECRSGSIVSSLTSICLFLYLLCVLTFVI